MVIEDLIKKILKEATSEKSSRGSYVSPLLPGYREFEKHQNAPFTEFVTQWDDAMLDHDSLDGEMSTDKKTIKKRERRAEKISKFIKNNPDAFTFADDGGVMNSIPGKNLDAKPLKNFDPKKTVTKLGEWVEITQDIIAEDLAVWFGKKKKPKGSSQPKGPWVDICRKVNGKHPPCGRSDASEGSYPKCRAAGVAGKMSDSEKRNACQQKRKAEKNDPQSGKGQKPVMVSHKKKTNENMKQRIITLTEDDLTRIVKRVLNEETESETLKFPCLIKKYGEHVKSLNKDMTDSDLTWKRKLYFKDGRENSSIYSEINYGYDNLNEKFVRARTTRKLDTIEYYCNSGEVRYFNGKTTLYADESGNPTVDEQKQKIADTQWLKGYCDLIKFSSCVKTD
jgi:hypothetical protein